MLDAVESVVRRNLIDILAWRYPNAVISDRSAQELRPTDDGAFFLTYNFRKKISDFSGITLNINEGPKVFVGGISAQLEGESMPVTVDGFKGGDRTHINLPALQTETMKALKATGKPVVFVNMSGGAMGFEWEAANLSAIVQAWYGGQAGGQAIADILFGDVNPSGRLPITFYKSVYDLPDFEDYSITNRTYRYYKGEPLYPFGFGLSYTKFKYSNLDVPATLKANTDLKVTVNVTNAGKRAGDEVVQLYVSHKNSTLQVPILALKVFQRVNLKAGETKTLTFDIPVEDLSIIDRNGKSIQVDENIEVSVGGGQPMTNSISEGGVIQEMVRILH